MRKLPVLLVAVMSALIGCQGGDDPEQNLTNPTASAAPDPTAPPAAKKDVQFGAGGQQSSFGGNAAGQ